MIRVIYRTPLGRVIRKDGFATLQEAFSYVLPRYMLGRFLNAFDELGEDLIG